MSGLTATFYDRQMLIFGGYNNNAALDGLYSLDLDTLEWTEVQTAGPRPSARTSHSAAIDPHNALLYIFGGSGSQFGHTNLNDLYVLDLRLRLWRQMALHGEEILPRYGQSMTWHNGRLYIFGGTFGREFSQDLFIVDTATGACRRMEQDGSAPTARYKHAAAIYNGSYMLVFGGAERQNYKLNDVAMLDLRTLKWTKLECTGTKPGGRFAHSMCIEGDTAFVFGGTDREACQSDLYMLNLSTRIWTKVQCGAEGRSPRGRYFHGAILDSTTGKMIVWGGKGSTEAQIRFNDLHAIQVCYVEHADPARASLSSDLHRLFESGSMADLHCSNGRDAHQLVIRARATALAERIDYDDDGHAVLPIDSPNPVVVDLLLRYLYTDQIDPFHCSTDDDFKVLIEVAQLAERLVIQRLARLAERMARHHVTTARAHAALRHLGDTPSSLQHFLRQFIAIHSGLSATIPVSMLPSDVQGPTPDVVVPPSSLLEDFGRLRRLSSSAAELQAVPFDMRFVCGRQRERIGAHQLLLAARSSYFGSFSFLEGMVEARTRVCRFPESGEGVLSRAAFSVLLDYLYGGDRLACTAMSDEAAAQLAAIDVCNFFGLSSMHLHDLLRKRLQGDPQDTGIIAAAAAAASRIRTKAPCSLS
ncbi:hypothetical protein PBRA_003651 [Plasmodiophora brassicae]|nr:hypothetical protein PBRA_003651 [Plasmodiophora brassicae]